MTTPRKEIRFTPPHLDKKKSMAFRPYQIFFPGKGLSSFRGEDFFLFHPPFFLFLAWWPSWLEVGITGHKFGRGPPKDHSTKVWLQLARWFLRRRLKCEMLTDGRWMKSDGNNTDLHDITEILLKVVLKAITLTQTVNRLKHK